MIFKKAGANRDFIMGMGEKAGNLKKPTRVTKNAHVVPEAKKSLPAAVQHKSSPRQKLGAIGTVKT